MGRVLNYLQKKLLTFCCSAETFCKSPYKVMQATSNYWAPTKCKAYFKKIAVYWARIPESQGAFVSMPRTHAESCFNCFWSVSSLWRFVAQSQIPVLLWNRNNICDTGTNSRWMAGSTDQQLNFTSAFNCLQKLFIAWCTPPRQHYLLNKHVVPGWQGRGAYQVRRNKYGRTPSCTGISI